jgi:hypothetical protein
MINVGVSKKMRQLIADWETWRMQRTYALMRITLDDSESARVLGILHDKPVYRIISILSFMP